MTPTEIGRRAAKKAPSRAGRTFQDPAARARELEAAGRPGSGGKATTLRYPAGAKVAALLRLAGVR